MSNRTIINREVTVTSLYFENRGGLKSYPRQIELDGREYTFMRGLRYLVQKGRQMTQIFDMTDGQAEFRLRFDAANHLWTLIDMAELPRAV